MNKQEYMEQLKKRLKRLPPEDFERAVEYFEEYFAEAGVENEEKAIEDLGTPQEAADQIIRDMALDYAKEPVKNVKKGLNGLWVGLLAVCAAPVAVPLLAAGVILIAAAAMVVFSILFSFLIVAACGVIAGPVTVIAGFTVLTKSVPVFLCCVGIGLASTGIGAALTYGMYLLCRSFLGWAVKGIGNMIQRGGRKNA